MDARSRGKLAMAASAAKFSRGHPDESPGYEAILSGVEKNLARAEQAHAEQRSGLLGVSAAAARKQELRHTMREGHLAHIAQVARAARREASVVAPNIVFRPGATTHVAEARAAHVRASAEIRRLADEAVQGVRVLDRFNRLRFRGSPEVLAAWRSVSSVVATPRGKTEPEGGSGSGGAPQDGGEVRPAA